MSNLSDIGFPTPDDQAVNEMIMHVLELAAPVKATHGIYLNFADESGAEIYLQGNFQQELIGFNPHFAGKSRFKVQLSRKIERDSSELDGGYYARALFSDEAGEPSDFPFVFDAPDFRLSDEIDLPQIREIQLTAFASNDLRMFGDEQEFADVQNSESAGDVKSFAASGLFAFDETDASVDLSPLRPIAVVSGVIKEFELKTNKISGANFYWFLAETRGGEIDIVADTKLISGRPSVGGVLSGQFWLSGKLINSAN